MRIDGCGFSKLTKSFKKPYDPDFIQLMDETAKFVLGKVENFRFCSVQSDEINICSIPANENTQGFFNGSINKIVSTTASAATAYFNTHSSKLSKDPLYARFDCRAFNIPKEECFNYFLSRQNDTTRNAISMAARTFFSHKKILNKNSDEMKEMLKSIGNPFEDLPIYFTHGRFFFKEKTIIQNPFSSAQFIERKVLKKDSFILLDRRSQIEEYFNI